MTILTLITRELSATRPLRDFANLRAEDHLFDDLGLDELDRICLACGIEQELHIDLPDSVIESWITVGCVQSSVERLAPYPKGNNDGR